MFDPWVFRHIWGCWGCDLRMSCPVRCKRSWLFCWPVSWRWRSLWVWASILMRGRGRGRPCHPSPECTTLGPANWIPSFLPLVYLGSLHPSLPVVALSVLSSLAACQIDQDQLSTHFVIGLSNQNLTNGMGAGTSIIGHCSMSGSIRVCLLHNSKQVFSWLCVLLSEARYLYIPIFILKDVEHALFIQQIKASSSIYLEIAHSHRETFFSQFEQLMYYQFLKTVHSVGLSWASLSIGEARDDSLFDDKRQ